MSGFMSDRPSNIRSVLRGDSWPSTALKTLFGCLLATGLVCSTQASATANAGFADADDLRRDANSAVRDFTSVEIAYDEIGYSRFKTPENADQRIKFGALTALAGYYHYVTCTEAVGLSLGYLEQDIHWKQSPEFRQTTFENMLIDVGAFTTRFSRWLIKGLFRAQINTESFSDSDNYLYTTMAWGRYDLCNDWYFHMGFIVEWGMEKSKMWPIIGIEGRPWKCVKLNLIYPLDLSAKYFFYDQFYLGTAIHFFHYRNHLKGSERVSKGFFEYDNTGVEAQIGYELCPIAKAELHAGRAFGNDIKVSDRNHENTTHHKFKGAAYFGGSIEVKF